MEDRPIRRSAPCSPTTTSTSAPTTTARPLPTTSRRPTPTATAPSRTSAGSPSSAWPSTSIASPSRSTSGSTRGGEWARDDVDAYCEFVREETDLRLGIEADFVAGREDRLANFLDAREWDYVIGSVHFLADEAVDMEDFERLGRAASRPRRSGGATSRARRGGAAPGSRHHGPPDLVKVWGGYRRSPSGDLRRYYDPAIEALPREDVAVEASTAGLRKPVAEIYPSRRFLEMAVDAGLPVALSSDAHAPDHLGFGYDHALELLGRPASPSSASSSAANAASSRSADPHRHRHRHPSLRDGRPRILAASRSRGEEAWPATRTPTCSPTPRRRAARRGGTGGHRRALPDTDRAMEDADSMALLRAARQGTAAGWAVATSTRP